MEHKETDQKGSFLAWGVGLNYSYAPDDKKLNILNAKLETPLLQIKSERLFAQSPLDFVRNTDKATQIYALMMSNNATNNLTDVFDDMRLVSILENSTKLARYCFDLKNRDFQRFSDSFCEDFNLKRIKIKKICHREPQNGFYVGKLKTHRNNSTRAMGATLHETLRRLSDKALNDLIAKEDLSVYRRTAHDLLGASSNLATLSRILDTRFSPHRRIAAYNRANEQHQKTARKTN